MNGLLSNAFSGKQCNLLAVLFCCVTINNSAAWSQPLDPGPVAPKPVERISPEALSRLFGGPILLTLQFQNASAREVFNALRQQVEKSGLKLRVANELLLAQQKEPVTINMVNRPIWEVMREVAPLLGLFVQGSAGTSNEIVFGKQGLFLQGPAVITPPCIIILDGLRGTRTLYPNSRPSQSTLELLFRILVDPKIRSSPHSYRFNILEAKDEDGLSLLPADQRMTNNHYSEGRLAMGVQVENLLLPARTDGKLVTLRGTLRFLAQTKSEIWEVPDILKVKNISKTLVTPRGTERYEIIQAVEQDDRYSTITAKVTREFQQVEIQEGQPFYSFDHNLSSLMRVLDADGKELPPAGGGYGDDNQELTIDFGVTRIAQEPRGRPTTLIWEIPTEYKEVIIPFEFKDLLLP